MRHQQNQNKKKQLRNEMKIVATASQFFRNAGFSSFPTRCIAGLPLGDRGGIQSRWSRPRLPIGHRRYSRLQPALPNRTETSGLKMRLESE